MKHSSTHRRNKRDSGNEREIKAVDSEIDKGDWGREGVGKGTMDAEDGRGGGGGLAQSVITALVDDL